MKASTVTIIGTVLFVSCGPLFPGEAPTTPSGDQPAAAPAQATTPESAIPASAKAAPEPPPLPFHTIEGYGGGAITPMAYLVNPSTTGKFYGLPAVAATYAGLGSKSLTAMTVTETLFKRIELGYAADHLTLGSLPEAIEKATTVDIETDHVWLHNLNVRGLVLTAPVPDGRHAGELRRPARLPRIREPVESRSGRT